MLDASAAEFEPMKIPMGEDVEATKAGALAHSAALAKENTQLALDNERLAYENEILRLKAQSLLGSGVGTGTASIAPHWMAPQQPWWPGMYPWAAGGLPSGPWECGDAESTVAPSERRSRRSNSFSDRDRSSSFGSERDQGTCWAGYGAEFGDSKGRDRINSCDPDDLEDMDIEPPPGLEAPQDARQPKTTLMMRNLPNNYTRSMLLKLFDDEGFNASYDLVYLPIDFKSQAGFGYAFVNFVSNEEAERFKQHFQNFTNWALPSEKVCDVDWSEAHQGLAAHVARYRNSPVMHEAVPDEFKPIVFNKGERVKFPEPTKKPRAPRVRRRP